MTMKQIYEVLNSQIGLNVNRMISYISKRIAGNDPQAIFKCYSNIVAFQKKYYCGCHKFRDVSSIEVFFCMIQKIAI